MNYVYNPYHPWRHGYRREKCRTAFFWILRFLLAAEILILGSRYIKDHTVEHVYEKEIIGEEAFGIGIEKGGEVFWFRKENEIAGESGK